MSATYLSYFLTEHTPAYGGRKQLVHIVPTSTLQAGNTTNELELRFPNHIGTHIDFPYHFYEEGKKCSDYPASFWIFHKVGLLQCSLEEVLNKIGDIPEDIDLLLLKTGFGAKRDEAVYWQVQPVIPAHFAKAFRKRFPKLRLFGFDLISLTSQLDKAEGKKAHLAFLVEEDILVLEDMDFSSLQQAPEAVYVFPLQVAVADGVPCTVIAV